MSPLTAVTGATGLLGRRLCEMLVARGERVIALGRDFSRFPSLDPLRCRLAYCALNDVPQLRAALAGADAVIHGAALSSPWGRREDFLRVNVDGTDAVVEVRLDSGATVRARRPWAGRPDPGSRVSLTWAVEHEHRFDPQTGVRR